MVRYRLLVLTSVPIIITLLALIALTMYWTLAYSWKSALAGVNADLAVASNSMEVLQREQRLHLNAIVKLNNFWVLVRIISI